MLTGLRMSYYAVARGRQTGIFRSWGECESQVKGFAGARFKKFASDGEAQAFMEGKAVAQDQKTSLKRPASFSKTLDKVMKKAKQKKSTNGSGSEDDEFMKFPEYPDGSSSSRAKTAAFAGPSSSKSEPPLPQDEKKKDPLGIQFEQPDPTTEKLYNGIKFQEDSKGYVHVYTDGSCEGNGKSTAVAGLGVYFGENHALNVSEPVTGRPTNNAGEIQASIRAIRDAQKSGVKRLNILTDSQFLINSVCKWMPGWKKKNWKLKTGKDVVNQKDFKELDSLIESGNMLIKWSYIPAHKGYHGNEEADRLAKIGARLYGDRM